MELRFQNNGILSRFEDVYECISELHGIQSQYDLYAYIALINRVKNIELNELFIDENIVKSWGQRVTLHINTKENMFLNKMIFSSKDNWIKKYINQLGGECDKIVEQIVNADYKNNCFSKIDIQNHIHHVERGKMMQWGGVLAQASIEGYVYEVLDGNKEKKYSKLNFTLNKNLNYEQAIEKLIKKYILAYGPVSLKDFAHWSGLKKCDFEKKWKEVVKDYERYQFNEEEYYYIRCEIFNQRENILLLGKFDPLLLAYHDKTWLMGEQYLQKVWKAAGQVEGIILVDYVFVGTWRCNQKNKKLFFYISNESVISKSILNEIEGKMYNITKKLKKSYGGMILKKGKENE